MALVEVCDWCDAAGPAYAIIDYDNQNVCPGCLVEALDKAKDELVNIQSIGVHKRKCWSCGQLAWHVDCVSPYVECRACGSADTRRVKREM